MRRHRTIPLAYFLTYTTYGTWLHGRAPGSVDKQHNQFGAPFLPADPTVEGQMRHNMKEMPFKLDPQRRRIVRPTIQEVSRHRAWRLVAVHVRSTHIHIIVAGNADPDKMLDDYKAYSTRRLKEAGLDRDRFHRWTPGGSTRFLWKPQQLFECVDYVVNRQGEPMEVFQACLDTPEWTEYLAETRTIPESTFESESTSEPEA